MQMSGRTLCVTWHPKSSCCAALSAYLRQWHFRPAAQNPLPCSALPDSRRLTTTSDKLRGQKRDEAYSVAHISSFRCDDETMKTLSSYRLHVARSGPGILSSPAAESLVHAASNRTISLLSFTPRALRFPGLLRGRECPSLSCCREMVLAGEIQTPV